MKGERKGDRKTDWFLAVVFLVGAVLFMYPTVSNQWNLFHQSAAIDGYEEAVSRMGDSEYGGILEAARDYNEALSGRANRYCLSPEEQKEYEQILNVSGSGVMGYIEIPKIQVAMPIYHGTSGQVLQTAAGHLPGSSVPVGGPATHCVVTGHRGLPSARLFTDLDQMEEGDRFFIRILNETLTYEVDRILTVEPENMKGLEFETGRDYCTLVTCTPYGVNSHRMLVRGHRVSGGEEAADVRVTADAVQIDPFLAAPMMALPVLLVLFIWQFRGRSGGHVSRRREEPICGGEKDRAD